MRTVASSGAFWRGISLAEICQTATWSLEDIFIHHYALGLKARWETQVGKAILLFLVCLGEHALPLDI